MATINKTTVSLLLAILIACGASTAILSDAHRPLVALLTDAQTGIIIGGSPITMPPTCYEFDFYSCDPCGVQIKCWAYNGGSCYDEAGSWFCPVTTASQVNQYNTFMEAPSGLDSLVKYMNKPAPCETVTTCSCVFDPNNPKANPACSGTSSYNDCNNTPLLSMPAGNDCP